MPKKNTADSVFGHHGVPTESEFFRRQSLYEKWPVDGKLSVWIEIVRHTADKTEYVGEDHRFMLHIFSTLKHTLPDYDWAAADKKLENEVVRHLEHFNMPAWNRIMEKLVRDEYDGLQFAMEQLMAKEVKSSRLPGLPAVLAPYLLRDFKFPPVTHHITMNGMVLDLIKIINKARKWKDPAQGYVSIEKALQGMAEMPHVFKLYKQDLEDLKARVGPKTDDQSDFLKSIHSGVGI